MTVNNTTNTDIHKDSTPNDGLWQHCAGEQHIQPIAGTLYRLVESQEHIATMGYVDTLAEQALLEDLLETVKPSYVAGTEHLHYLLKTPFRYPPLKWGSRFGAAHEKSIFYGGCHVAATLAECAYYRFVFWQSMQLKPADSTHNFTKSTPNKIITEHMLFSVDYQTKQGIKLQKMPFAQYQSMLIHPQNYSPTQALGTAMREAGVAAFEYTSAREPTQGMCVGLFSATAFVQNQPTETHQWLCETQANEVAFKKVKSSEVYRFYLSNFLLENGKLPFPA